MPATADDHHQHHDIDVHHAEHHHHGGTAINDITDITDIHFEPGRYHVQHIDLFGPVVQHGPCTDDDCTRQHVYVTPADD